MSKVIWGREIRAEVTDHIAIDQGAHYELTPCTDWDAAEFRAYSYFTGNEIACNVEITGRTIQRRYGSSSVRVRVTFVGDGEPDEVAYGWLTGFGNRW